MFREKKGAAGRAKQKRKVVHKRKQFRLPGRGKGNLAPEAREKGAGRSRTRWKERCIKGGGPGAAKKNPKFIGKPGEN